jgi:hypothetical protein
VTVRLRRRGALTFELVELRCRSVTPGQQLVDPGDLVVGDPAEDAGEPSLRKAATTHGRPRTNLETSQ